MDETSNTGTPSEEVTQPSEAVQETVQEESQVAPEVAGETPANAPVADEPAS